MINARAIAVQGYGYGALAIAERGYIGVTVLDESGGTLAKTGGATEVMAREILARQDDERLRKAIEAAEIETAELLDKIARNSDRARRRNEAFQETLSRNVLQTIAVVSATNTVAENVLSTEQIALKRIKDNQNRALILLALLMA